MKIPSWGEPQYSIGGWGEVPPHNDVDLDGDFSEIKNTTTSVQKEDHTEDMKVSFDTGVVYSTMKKILSVRLEPDGEERLLITEPILRQIDSNGRIFVSKDCIGKDVLLLLAYPIDDDFKRFNPVKKRKIEIYERPV